MTKTVGKRILSGIIAVERGVLLITLSVMVVAVSLEVFFRYVLNNPLAGTEEAARYLMVWMVLVGASLATYREDHVRIDILYKFIRTERGRRLVEVVTSFVVIIIMCFFVKWSYDFVAFQARVHFTWEYLDRFPLTPISSALVVGGGLIVLHLVLKVVKAMVELRK